MQTQNYWKQFENTGKIEDYLSYKAYDSQCPGNRDTGCKSAYQETFGSAFKEEGSKDSHAGIYPGDGNDHKAISHGRI